MIIVIEYMLEYSGMLFAALVLLAIQAMCDLSLPDYMSDIVNTGIISGNVSFIVQTGVKMLLITLLGAVCSIADRVFRGSDRGIYRPRYESGCI